jgi:hypothetical protein|tara:strand:+ start:940 stop:2673 length:1734 start_codon:yes stop_codon:yes gene_type:complete
MKKGKYIIDIQVDNQDANEAIQVTAEKLEDLEQQSTESLEQIDNLSGGLISNFKGVVNMVQGSIKALKTLKGVLIATGIGAFALAVASVSKAFTNSEEGQNKFAKLMAQIGVVTGNVFDILEDLGNALLNYASILGNVVTLNFKAAKESFQDLKGSLGEVVDGVKNFGEETKKEIAIAGDLADARAKADKIERDLIVDRAEADRLRADLLEKAVDRDKFSTEERISFLEQASALEEEITNQEIELAKIRLNTKIEENKLSGSTKEDLQEEAELRAQVIQLETARLSKQKEVTSQTIALRNEEKAAREKEEADQKAKDEKEAAELEAFRIAQREAIAIDEDAKTELLLTKEQERFDKLIAQATELGQSTEELEAAKLVSLQNIRDAAQKVKDDKEKAANDKKLAADKAQADAEEAIEKQKFDTALQFTSLGIGILAEGSNAAKALGIAQAIISTYTGAADVLKTAPTLAAKIAGVATVLATGFQQVRAIQQTQIPVLSVGGVTAAGGAAAPVPQIQPPSFNVVGSSPINQLTEAIAGQQSQPVRAFVVAGDVTTAQELERNRIRTSALTSISVPNSAF